MDVTKVSKICFILFLIVIEPVFAQTKNSIEIEIKILTMGDRAKNYENVFLSSLQNELLKIPDVKLTEKSNYIIIVSFFELPCKCDWFNFHYRIHFVNNNKIDWWDVMVPVSEGYSSYEEIEKLAKSVISNINVRYLKE